MQSDQIRAEIERRQAVAAEAAEGAGDGDWYTGPAYVIGRVSRCVIWRTVSAYRRRRRVPDMTSRGDMQALLWAEVKTSGETQARIAELAGVTPKHLSQLMRGHATGSLDTIDAVLAACGRRLVLSTRVLADQREVDGA